MLFNKTSKTKQLISMLGTKIMYENIQWMNELINKSINESMNQRMTV